MPDDDWIVHPNRFALGPDRPGRNGHLRTVTRPRPAITTSTCVARVGLPERLAAAADEDGTVTFAGMNWWFVVGAARDFARDHLDDEQELLAPFGFRRRGVWWWWDDTMSEVSILDTPDATEYVREYIEALFGSATVELTDRR